MSTIWDARARLYDVFEASDLRRGPAKAKLFRAVTDRTLFLAIGTGLDIRHLPSAGAAITGLDISGEMLRRCKNRCGPNSGNLNLVQADAESLPFSSDVFDTAATSCTMCSVPHPLRALREIYRVLRPGGRLLMFEHVRSKEPILGIALDLMTLFTRGGGTEMNRDTLANIAIAGFQVVKVESVFLDIILAIHATKIGPNFLGSSLQIGSSFLDDEA